MKTIASRVFPFTFPLALLAGCVAPSADDSATNAGSSESTGSTTAADTNCAHSVAGHGGPVLTTPTIIHLYWGKAWDYGWTGVSALENLRMQQTKKWNWIANDQGFWAPLNEYSPGIHGSFGGEAVGNWDVASSSILSESAIIAELAYELTGGGGYQIPSFSAAQPMYIVYLPPGVRSQLDATKGYGGHHGSFTHPDGSGRLVMFAVIEYGGDYDAVEGHEIWEASTDPIVGKGFIDDATNPRKEVGDLCEEGQPHAAFGTLSLEQVWSQSQCRCVAAVPQTTQPTVAPPSGGTGGSSGGGGPTCPPSICPPRIGHPGTFTNPTPQPGPMD